LEQPVAASALFFVRLVRGLLRPILRDRTSSLAPLTLRSARRKLDQIDD
jgi:hypothetical protein